jgi:hypothetical protein
MGVQIDLKLIENGDSSLLKDREDLFQEDKEVLCAVRFVEERQFVDALVFADMNAEGEEYLFRFALLIDADLPFFNLNANRINNSWACSRYSGWP